MDYTPTRRPKRRHKKKTAQTVTKVILFLLGVVLGILLCILQKKIYICSKSKANCYLQTTTTERLKALNNAKIPEWVDRQFIAVDGSSRNGTELGGMNDIVIHYIGNPDTTAQQNRDYFANPDSDVSAHFVIGLDGEIIQCIPLNEMSAASNWRNRDTISIEVCHPDESGKFTEATYKSLVRLTAWLMNASMLDTTHIIRHHDITGKDCPLYFVDHEDAWTQFLEDVKNCEP